MYEARANHVRLASVDENGTPFDHAVLGEGSGAQETSLGAFSRDGEHIFMSVGPGGNDKEIFRRSHGTQTTHVSPTKLEPPDPGGPRAKEFKMATPDGERVFFTSSERLTENANEPTGSGDLYRYDIAADELTNLSASTPGDQAGEVHGLVGLSDAGDRVYFVASGEVAPGPGPQGEHPVPGGVNLYPWEDDGTDGGSARFITTLAGDGPGSSADEGVWRWQGHARRAQVTRDGAHLAFRSYAEIGGYDPAGTGQVYLYSADASAQGELTCVSCPASGAASADAAVPYLDSGFGDGNTEMLPRFLSEDGSRVFFSSTDPLLERDTNGQFDAYMWQDGEVHLLSTGRSSDDSYFHAASANGDSAFFRTREALVAQDSDWLVDVYVARVNGGLEAQQRAFPPRCAGDECQADAPESPAFSDLPTEGQSGRGNVAPARQGRSCAPQVRRARVLIRRAKVLRRTLRRSRAVPRARQVRRRAIRVNRLAKRQVIQARRCRQASRRAGR